VRTGQESGDCGFTTTAGCLASSPISESEVSMLNGSARVWRKLGSVAMNSFWILVGIPSFGLLCFSFIFLKRRDPRLAYCVTPVVPFGSSHRFERTRWMNDRMVKWISPEKCARLLSRSPELTLINIQSATKMPAFVASKHDVVSLTLSDFFDLLIWLPESSGVIVCGASDSYTSIKSDIHRTYGHAAISSLCSELISTEKRAICPAQIESVAA
jgi:hypothetical protein